MVPYYEWNKLLLNYFFNYENEGKRTYNLFIDRKILNDLAGSESGYEDFIKSIESKISRGGNFFSEFETLYEKSQQKFLLEGKLVLRKTPEYFGFLMFLIFALSEGDDDKFNITNIYGRINIYGANAFNKKWKKITTQISKRLLDPAWFFLEYWANKIHNGKLGSFQTVQTGEKIHARRIAAHVLFHYGHLNRLLDVLVENDILPGEEIPTSKLISLMTENERKIGISALLLDIPTENSDLAKNIISLIKGMIKNAYTERTKASSESKRSIPPIPLRLVLRLPSGFSKTIETTGLRAYSHELMEDKIQVDSKEYLINYQIAGLSEILAVPATALSKNIEYFSEESKQRFFYSDGSKWLLKNHVVNEWIESAIPCNDSTLLLFGSDSLLLELPKEQYNNYKQYSLPIPNKVLLKFELLSTEQFKQLVHIVNPETEYEGKIQLHGTFLSNRRTTIYKEFEYSFEYTGEVDNPELRAKVMEEDISYDLIKNEQTDPEGQKYYLWKLPDNFPQDAKFKVVEANSNVKSHLTYQLSAMGHSEPESRNFFLKDEEGKYLGEATSADIFDLPNNFINSATSNLVKYLAYQKLYRKNFLCFYGEYSQYAGKELFDYKKEQEGNLLLNYLNSNPSINTTEFYQMIQYLDSSADIKAAKRMMYYWRYLGYLDFQSYGGKVSVNKGSILYLQTDRGIKAVITGARMEDRIPLLEKKCKQLGLKLITEDHSSIRSHLLPQKIIIYDAYAFGLEKLKRIAAEFNLQLNNERVVYQLAAFYNQVGLQTFYEKLSAKDIYEQGHHRKQYFDLSRLKWEETTKDISSLNQPLLIRYNGFKDNSVKHLFVSNNIQYILPEYSLAVFYLLWINERSVLRRKINPGYNTSDLFVPIQLPLPYWIEKGLLLSNASIPYIGRVSGIAYRIYEKIPDSIISYIADKLGQKLITLTI
jgi:hypothetical protein